MKTSSLKNKLALAAVVLTAGVTFVACTPATQDTTTDSEMMIDDSTMVLDDERIMMNDSTVSGDMMMGPTGEVDPMTGVRTITMEAGSFYYTPNVIKVKKGETVRIVLNSVDMMHDFTIDELGVTSEAVKGGESDTIEFVASEAGAFEYYCSVGEHRANGQVGTLIVE